MKIAFITGNLEPTGGDRILYHHVKILKDFGHDVMVYSPGWIENDPKNNVWYNSGLYKFVKDIPSNAFNDCDMVVANGLWGARVTLTLNHPNKIWFCQNFDPYIFGPDRDIDNTYNGFNKFLLYSNDLKKIIKHYYGDKKFVVCSNGIQYDMLKLFQKTNFPCNKRICWMTSCYRSYKGIKFANEIFRELKRRKYLTVEIAATSGPLENTMEFHSNPEMTIKNKLVAECDIMIHPSVFETWNLVSMESMALGTPVVGVNSKGIMEYATKDNSIIFEERNPKLICDAIDMLYFDENKYSNLQKNGIETAKNHDWSKIRDNILNSYVALLDKNEIDWNSMADQIEMNHKTRG